MKNSKFVLDMADERANFLKDYAKFVEVTKISKNITLTKTDISSEELARRFFKNAGLYYTVSCKSLDVSKNKIVSIVSNCILECIKGKSKKNILVVGLGNEKVALDSLGARVSENIDTNNKKLHAVSVGVYRMTGIKSVDIIKGIVNEISSDLVIIIDTLATSKMERIYKSFQVTNTGLVPGSATGYGVDIIDKSTLNVDTIAIGVPTCIYARSLVYDGMNILGQHNSKNIRGNLASVLGTNDLNTLLTKKDIERGIEVCGKLIADSINKAFL